MGEVASKAGDWAFKAFTAGLGVATIYLAATFSVGDPELTWGSCYECDGEGVRRAAAPHSFGKSSTCKARDSNLKVHFKTSVHEAELARSCAQYSLQARR
ncbi:hypothetical protein HYC85_000096 [Camellia sinensis]|uniref:Uncharacterized protein n=1 Tax=Camellia sinensis TaxID=4442 RepID=A0A7J7FPN4_CAMSI|nr:hypothetical protein HYC85_000096 [Camellia sinensis]